MPSRFLRAAILPAAFAALAPAHAGTAPYGVDVCTLSGTSGQYSVRVRNTGSAPLARADITGVRLDGAGRAQGDIAVSLAAIPPADTKPRFWLATGNRPRSSASPPTASSMASKPASRNCSPARSLTYRPARRSSTRWRRSPCAAGRWPTAAPTRPGWSRAAPCCWPIPPAAAKRSTAGRRRAAARPKSRRSSLAWCRAADSASGQGRRPPAWTLRVQARDRPRAGSH